MKECKIVRMNDGLENELLNGEFMHILTLPREEKMIEFFLDLGYEVKQIVRDFSPGMARPGELPFYKSGLIFYLEREVADESEMLDDSEILKAWRKITENGAFQHLIDERKKWFENDEEETEGFYVDDDIDEDDFYDDDDFEDDEDV